MAQQRTHRIRIVGGRWKRTPLAVPDVRGLRPTPDRVRETLFDWLGGDLSGLVCLDLFAGTGALGLEAASRGAAEVLLVESDRGAARAIGSTLARLDAKQVTLRPGDALAALALAQRTGRRFDLVFVDPPFGRGWLAKVLPRIPGVAAPGARVYLESDAPIGQADADRLLGPGWEVVRTGQAGQVFYHLLLDTRSQKGEES